MKIDEKDFVLGEEDLKEIFAIFTSATEHEKRQIYDPCSRHYFRKVKLLEELELTAPKREYAIDCWRAVMYFLYSRGFAIVKDGTVVCLSFSEGLFVRD